MSKRPISDHHDTIDSILGSSANIQVSEAYQIVEIDILLKSQELIPNLLCLLQSTKALSVSCSSTSNTPPQLMEQISLVGMSAVLINSHVGCYVSTAFQLRK